MTTRDQGLSQRLNISQVQGAFVSGQVTALDAAVQGLRQVPRGYVLATSSRLQVLNPGWNRIELPVALVDETSVYDPNSTTLNITSGVWRVCASLGMDAKSAVFYNFQGLILMPSSIVASGLTAQAGVTAAAAVLYAVTQGADRNNHLHGCTVINPQIANTQGYTLWGWVSDGTTESNHPGLGHTWLEAERIR